MPPPPQDSPPPGDGAAAWPDAPVWRVLLLVGGLAPTLAVAVVGPADRRLTTLALGLVVLAGQLALRASLARANTRGVRLAATVWAGLVALLVLALPRWSPGTPVWLLALPAVVLPAGSSVIGGAAALVIAGAAAFGLTGAERSIAAAVLLGAGLLTAVGRRRGEEREVAMTRDGRALIAAREELKALRQRPAPVGEDRLVAVMRDNQALKLELERGKAIVEQAIDASRTKASFLSTISHELRTPLNAIVGYTELLLERADDAPLREDLGKVEGAARHLLGLVDGVLDLARLEAGKFEVQIEAFALDELLHEVVAAARPMAERAGDTLKLKLPHTPLGTIVSDRVRLRQVLVQLLANACKFTQDGLVELRAEPGTIGGGAAFVISVRDTGVGIDAAYLPRVFSPFSQADDSPTRRVGGLGLGLALCKHHCTLLGGEISVESEAGKGAVFRVLVPAASRDPREAGVALISSF